MNGRRFKMFACLAAAALVLFCAGNALAKAKGACVSCHTMHNSQNGVTVTGGDPVEALLSYSSCLACHTGTNIGLVGGVMNNTGIPYVLTLVEPTYTHASPSPSLAGGNFHWVNTGAGTPIPDSKGHNVTPMAKDNVFENANPPGWSIAYTLNGAVGTAWDSNQLTCAGTYGCHGDHTLASDFAAVKGAHHGDDSTIDGSTVVKSYRFLKGIHGKEDIDWEYTKAANDHNQYMGSSDAVEGTTISYLCAECHGVFHTAANSNGEDGTAPWLRHPTDLDMNTAGIKALEYGSYNGAGNPYSIEAPVASTVVTAVKSAVLVAAGDAIVTCVSCHRAHGSPYADLLRWDYDAGTTAMIAGNYAVDNNTGCFICHTTKDDD